MLRKKAVEAGSSRGTTVPVSVCLKAGTRENLTLLIAIRKTTNKAAGKHASVVAILDDAISVLATKLEGGRAVAFIPVPPNDCVRVSLRISTKTRQVAQKWAKAADVRVADFIRTALTFYLRKHASETARYARPKKR